MSKFLLKVIESSRHNSVMLKDIFCKFIFCLMAIICANIAFNLNIPNNMGILEIILVSSLHCKMNLQTRNSNLFLKKYCTNLWIRYCMQDFTVVAMEISLFSDVCLCRLVHHYRSSSQSRRKWIVTKNLTPYHLITRT